MTTIIRRGRKQRHASHWPAVIISLLFVALALSIAPYAGQALQNLSAWRDARVADMQRAPAKIEVVDGDTVRVQQVLYRLVGFNAPESGALAQCRSERVLADKASRRLTELIASRDARLHKVRCACAPGTEGTQHCNHGRLCGVVTASGVDVGEVLIAEGLAERYICRGTSCPPRRNWCG